MIPLFCEIDWSPVSGQAAVAVTFNWYLGEADVDPWYTETTTFSTRDRAVDDGRVLSYVQSRAQEVAEMYARYAQLAAALGIQAGVRFPVGGA